MPIYEYRCEECCDVVEHIRIFGSRDVPVPCYTCGRLRERILSVPAMQTWNQDRQFTNAVKDGDGKFETKAKYEAHLKANSIGEVSTDAPSKRNPGAKVIGTWR